MGHLEKITEKSPWEVETKSNMYFKGEALYFTMALSSARFHALAQRYAWNGVGHF